MIRKIEINYQNFDIDQYCLKLVEPRVDVEPGDLPGGPPDLDFASHLPDLLPRDKNGKVNAKPCHLLLVSGKEAFELKAYFDDKTRDDIDSPNAVVPKVKYKTHRRVERTWVPIKRPEGKFFPVNLSVLYGCKQPASLLRRASTDEERQSHRSNESPTESMTTEELAALWTLIEKLDKEHRRMRGPFLSQVVFAACNEGKTQREIAREYKVSVNLIKQRFRTFKEKVGRSVSDIRAVMNYNPEMREKLDDYKRTYNLTRAKKHKKQESTTLWAGALLDTPTDDDEHDV